MAQPIEPQRETRECVFCHRSGRCGKCNGAGQRVTTVRGRFGSRSKLSVECHACEGTGVCSLCQGTGIVVAETV